MFFSSPCGQLRFTRKALKFYKSQPRRRGEGAAGGECVIFTRTSEDWSSLEVEEDDAEVEDDKETTTWSTLEQERRM